MYYFYIDMLVFPRLFSFDAEKKSCDHTTICSCNMSTTLSVICVKSLWQVNVFLFNLKSKIRLKTVLKSLW